MNITRRLFLGLVLFLGLAGYSWATGCTGTGNCYWVGGTGNWSDTAHWATASGGATTGGLPGTTDNVIFDSASHTTAYTVTVDSPTTNKCADLTFAAAGDGSKPTLAGTSNNALLIYGNTVFVSGMTNSLVGFLRFEKTSGTQTLTSNSVQYNCSIRHAGAGVLQLVDDMTLNYNGSTTYLLYSDGGQTDFNSRLVTINTGTHPTYSAVIWGGPWTGTSSFYDLTITGSAAKTDKVDLGANIAVTHNLTINGNSATNRILVTSDSIGTARTITTGGTITLSNVGFRDITFQSTNARTISSAASDGGTGTRFLTAAAHGLVAGMNVLIAGTTNYNGSVAVTNVSDTTHFDIATAYVSSQSGTWTHDFSAQTDVGGGALSGLVGLTPSTPQSCYWVHSNDATSHNWSDLTGSVGTYWMTATGGSTKTRVPLMQDTAVFDANSFPHITSTVVQDMPRIGSVTWVGDGAGAVTNVPTWTTSTTASVFGSITLHTPTTGMVMSASTHRYTFEGRGSYTLTMAGNTWPKDTTLSAPSGTLTMQDAITFAVGRSITFDVGTFTTTYAVTVDLVGKSGGSNVATINMGSGTWTLYGTSGNLNIWAVNDVYTINGTGTIKITDATTGTKTFVGGGKTYANFWISPGSSTSSFNFIGDNTFTDFKDDGTAAHSVKFTKSTTTTVSSWNVGTASSRSGNTNVITLDTVDGAGTFTINQSVAGKVCASSLNITRSTVGGTGVTWFAGPAPPSTNGGTNSGWTFAGCASGRRTLLGVGP